VVVEILIPERNPKYPLPDKRCYLVLDQLRALLVVKAGRKSIYQPDRTIRCPEQQRTSIRGNVSPSNAATTSRPSTAVKPNKSILQSVVIGAFPNR
jgi:hypothetical protein